MAYRIEGGPLWQMLNGCADLTMSSISGYGDFYPRIEKDWGDSRGVLKYEKFGLFAAVSDAHRVGKQSSRHYHEHADNFFIMLSGTIGVSVEDNPVEFLSEGDVFCVPHGQHHHFTVVEPAVFVEVYLSPVDKPLADEDIIRVN